MTRAASVLVAALALVLVTGASSTTSLPLDQRSEVVVLLGSPPLARAPGSGATIVAEQRSFRRELAARVPDADIGWRYRLVANGFSLTLPEVELSRLRALPGVREVLPAGSYAPRSESTPLQIGAPALWGPTLDTAGQGVKIGRESCRERVSVVV